MFRKRHRSLTLFLAFVASFLLLVGTGLAQQGSGYDLGWSTVDSGGGFSAGGAYTLGGTAGQPDAGHLGFDAYTLAAGFWHGGTPPSPVYEAYLPLILREGP